MKKIIFLCVIGATILYGGFFMYYVSQAQKFDVRTEMYRSEAKRIFEAIPTWHKKIKTEQIIKIGIITDTHVHPNRINRYNKSIDAPRYIGAKDNAPIIQFAKQMSTQFYPDFVVHTGDIIEGTKETVEVGMQGLQLVQKELNKINVPVYWTVGNHDLRSVTKDQFRDALGVNALDQVFDEGDYRFIILDANYDEVDVPFVPKGHEIIPGKLSEKTLTWLKEQLATEKRVFIFIHQGTFLHDLAGDAETPEEEIAEDASGKEYEEERTIDNVEYYMKKSIINAQELNDILKEYRVDGIFNGHMEARAYEVVDRTAHYSLTGTEKSETYPESYYELTINEGVPNMTMYYSSPIDYKQHKVDFESGEK